MIPLCKPYIDKKELNALKEALESGWLTEGPKNTEFEDEFAKYIGVKKAVALNSCTAALQLSIQALGITGEVILPSFTFVASANAILTAGAKPVFADIEYESCNIDPDKISEKITQKTQAIMPVHFGGQSCQMDKIIEISKKYNLYIIEDSAETIGGEFKGKKTGSFGIGCFSFFPTKNMTTGEGGMLTTDDEKLAKKIKTLAGHGIAKGTLGRENDFKPWIRDAHFTGYNFRLSNLLAAMGVEQLKKIETMNHLRRQHAAYLTKHLTFDEIVSPTEKKECKHVYQMYTIKLKNVDRIKFIQNLRSKGIGASVHFDPPVHLQTFYKQHFGYKEGDFPLTEKVSQSIVTLPMYPKLTQKNLDYMIKIIGETLTKLKTKGPMTCR